MAARSASTAAELARFRARVYRLVRLIPPGRVATYGQLSVLAGHPRRARFVGQALARHGGEDDLPWHRVLNAAGRVSPRGGESRDPALPVERRQQRLLEAEGVPFAQGRVNLARYRWRPEEEGGTLAAAADGRRKRGPPPRHGHPAPARGGRP
jgi:methylated-DNA-protein-cysteine methyltransferase-like protein